MADGQIDNNGVLIPKYCSFDRGGRDGRLKFLPSASPVVQRQPNELPITDWGRSRRRVGTTIKNTLHLPSRGVVKNE